MVHITPAADPGSVSGAPSGSSQEHVTLSGLHRNLHWCSAHKLTQAHTIPNCLKEIIEQKHLKTHWEVLLFKITTPLNQNAK